MVTSKGKNHKGEEILKVYSANCPLCGEYMSYYEFIFNLPQPIAGNKLTDMEKLIRIQQIEELIEKVKKGEKMNSVLGLLFGCVYHYGETKKEVVDKLPKRPYITLDAEDVFNVNQTPISHVYLAQPI